MCALHGRLPGQDGIKISFASAPKDLEPIWWNYPGTHPTYTPVHGGYALGDVFFAEMAVTFSLCSNRGALFRLEVGETFECNFYTAGWERLSRKFQERG